MSGVTPKIRTHGGRAEVSLRNRGLVVERALVAGAEGIRIP